MQDSLAFRIREGIQLTKDEVDALVEILGYRCLDKTKLRLRRVLSFVPNIVSFGIYYRLMLSPRIFYCAGQSYPDEIRFIRKLLLEN